MDILESIEPSSTSILSSTPSEQAQVSLSPSPSTFSENTELHLGRTIFIVLVVMVCPLYIIVRIIESCYYRITGRPRPQRNSAQAGLGWWRGGYSG